MGDWKSCDVVVRIVYFLIRGVSKCVCLLRLVMFIFIFKVGFVSFGCFKVLVDFECIFIQLCMEGYEVVLIYEDVDVVVVNICGFIDSVKVEFLEVIGEVIVENGKVIVIGCMGVEEYVICDVYFSVLVVIGL